MPSILLPVNLDGMDISRMELPAPLNHFRLSGIPFTARRQPDMEYWQQEIRVNGFVIGQACWVNQKPINISCGVKEQCAILYYALQGAVHFYPINGAVMVLPAGQYGLLICPAASTLEIRLRGKQHHSIQLSLSIHLLQHLPGFGPGTFDEKHLTLRYVGVYSPFLPITKSIRATWSRFLFSDKPVQQTEFLRLNEGCLKLLARFTTVWLAFRQQQHWKERKEIRMEELEAYLKDHLDVESRHLATEKACAKKVGMNVYQFRKLWKERFGKTLSQYLLQCRMEKARQILLMNEETPATIYLWIGYQDFSSFSRAFSAWYGYPPSRVKK